MGEKPLYTSTIREVRVRRPSEKFGAFLMGTERRVVVQKDDVTVAEFEEAQHAGIATDLCAFLNGLPEAAAESVLTAIVQAHYREHSPRNRTPTGYLLSL